MILSHRKLTPLSKKNIPLALAVLVDAFMDYPLPGSFIKEPKRRKIVLREFYRIILKKAVIDQNAFHLEESPHEIAVWLTKDKNTTSFNNIRHISFSTLRILFSARLKEMNRLLGAVRNIDQMIKEQKFPSSAVELLLLAVAPDNQKQGRASKLLKASFESLDHDRVACFLTTNTKTNVVFYQKIGFKLTANKIEPNSKIPVFIMFRPSQTIKKANGELI